MGCSQSNSIKAPRALLNNRKQVNIQALLLFRKTSTAVAGWENDSIDLQSDTSSSWKLNLLISKLGFKKITFKMVFKWRFMRSLCDVLNAPRKMSCSIPWRTENFDQGHWSRVNISHFQHIQIFICSCRTYSNWPYSRKPLFATSLALHL